jgi:transcriptional regulator with PAS, ATPase and Fis domain
MSAYHWPGNVRELENEIRKLVLLSGQNESIGPDRLGSKFTAEEPAADHTPERPIPEGFSLYNHVASLEQRFIARALAETGGIKKHAAARLGIPESTLRLKIRQYSIPEA